MAMGVARLFFEEADEEQQDRFRDKSQKMNDERSEFCGTIINHRIAEGDRRGSKKLKIDQESSSDRRDDEAHYVLA